MLVPLVYGLLEDDVVVSGWSTTIAGGAIEPMLVCMDKGEECSGLVKE